MSTSSELDVAVAGDTIQGASLQASIDGLSAMATSLDDRIKAATDVDAIQALGAAQADLRSKAMALVNIQISLLADEVKITADHVNAATKYALGVIAEIADWRKAVQTIGKVVDFFAVVLTGNGAKILESAIALKAALDTP